MDAALNGGWAEVTVPLIKSESTDEKGDYPEGFPYIPVKKE